MNSGQYYGFAPYQAASIPAVVVPAAASGTTHISITTNIHYTVQCNHQHKQSWAEKAKGLFGGKDNRNHTNSQLPSAREQYYLAPGPQSRSASRASSPGSSSINTPRHGQGSQYPQYLSAESYPYSRSRTPSPTAAHFPPSHASSPSYSQLDYHSQSRVELTQYPAAQQPQYGSARHYRYDNYQAPPSPLRQQASQWPPAESDFGGDDDNASLASSRASSNDGYVHQYSPYAYGYQVCTSYYLHYVRNSNSSRCSAERYRSRSMRKHRRMSSVDSVGPVKPRARR